MRKVEETQNGKRGTIGTIKAAIAAFLSYYTISGAMTGARQGKRVGLIAEECCHTKRLCLTFTAFGESRRSHHVHLDGTTRMLVSPYIRMCQGPCSFKLAACQLRSCVVITSSLTPRAKYLIVCTSRHTAQGIRRKHYRRG